MSTIFSHMDTISCCFISSLAPSSPQYVDLLYDFQKEELARYIPGEVFKQHICKLVLDCTPIRSISFIPTSDAPQCLYMQRSPLPTIEGFITSEEGSTLPISGVHDEDSIEWTTRGMEMTYSHKICEILTIFLQDQSTRAISVTYLNGKGGLATRIWKKCSEVEFSR